MGEASEARKAVSSELRARARCAVNATKAFVSETSGTGCNPERGVLTGESWACRAYGHAAGF